MSWDYSLKFILWLSARVIKPKQRIVDLSPDLAVKKGCLVNWRRQAITWMANHRYSKVIIFTVIALPIPGTEYLALAASRYTKMSYSFFVIFTANAVRTTLVVLLGYYIGGKF